MQESIVPEQSTGEPLANGIAEQATDNVDDSDVDCDNLITNLMVAAGECF